MALVTQPPILIDGINFSRQSPFTAPKFLFRRGGNAYALLESQLDASIGMYKTTDEGLTWTLLDAANSPTPGEVIATYDDVGNDQISAALTDNTSVYYIDFSTTTDTWGTKSNSFAFMGTGWSVRALYRNLAGTPTILMNQGSSADLWAIQYIAAAWTAPGAPIFTAPATCGYGNGIRDAIGTYHLSFVTTANLYYLQISNTLIAGSAVLLVAGFGGGGFDTGRVVLDGAVVRGVAVVEPTAGHFEILAWAGTPLAAPVFTTYIVATTSTGDSFTFPDDVLDKDGNWVVVWVLQNFSTPLDQEMMATFNGTTFDAPVVFYDAVANPPPNVDAGSNFIHTDDLTQFSDGIWLKIVAMETLDLGGACTGFALTTAIGNPLTIICPVGGGTATIGVPYGPFDLNDDVTGGTPPYTFALIDACP